MESERSKRVVAGEWTFGVAQAMLVLSGVGVLSTLTRVTEINVMDAVVCFSVWTLFVLGSKVCRLCLLTALTAIYLPCLIVFHEDLPGGLYWETDRSQILQLPTTTSLWLPIFFNRHIPSFLSASFSVGIVSITTALIYYGRKNLTGLMLIVLAVVMLVIVQVSVAGDSWHRLDRVIDELQGQMP